MNSKVSYHNKDYLIDDLDLEGNVYQRRIGKDYNDISYNNFDELVGYLKLLNNDNYFINNISNYITTGKTKCGMTLICLCGCDRCETLFEIKNTKTDINFYVGSHCINKFLPSLYPTIKKIQKNETCVLCNKPLFFNNFKDRIKTANKKHCGHCIECWNL